MVLSDLAPKEHLLSRRVPALLFKSGKSLRIIFTNLEQLGVGNYVNLCCCMSDLFILGTSHGLSVFPHVL